MNMSMFPRGKDLNKNNCLWSHGWCWRSSAGAANQAGVAKYKARMVMLWEDGKVHSIWLLLTILLTIVHDWWLTSSYSIYWFSELLWLMIFHDLSDWWPVAHSLSMFPGCKFISLKSEMARITGDAGHDGFPKGTMLQDMIEVPICNVIQSCWERSDATAGMDRYIIYYYICISIYIYYYYYYYYLLLLYIYN